MQIHSTVTELRNALAQTKERIFVPTMGNLHDGHISLMRQAKRTGKTVVASIFVNPLQFGPSEDFQAYPRTLSDDLDKLHAAGVDFVFTPTVNDLYPEKQEYVVTPPEIQSILEGEFRPGHFSGVATVVLKLFNIVQPQAAVFGKKDYQQLMVIRNMTRQLALPIEIIGGETVRANDGLALSSRNGFLSASERAEAPRLFRTLEDIRLQLLNGARNFRELEEQACQALNARGWKTDYVSIRQQSDLRMLTSYNTPCVILAASRLGSPRLIDNLEV